MGQQQSTESEFNVPYETEILPAIGYGTQVHVYGTATGDRFEINLANNRGDIVLHVNPRVRDRVLVLNSAPSGNWGGEERKPLNFTTGDQFKLIIMVTEHSFKIAINDEHVADYNHRLPLNLAELVTVKGDFTLTNLIIYPGFCAYGQTWHFEKETPIPINVFPGRVLYIDGRADDHASRFEFNLLTDAYNGADVAFHFNPRFNQREAVRNTCQGGDWGHEEKDGGFPLQPGQNFEIQIVCYPEFYQVNCNGQGWYQYRHRIPYQSVKALQIKGDTTITSVRAL